MLTFLNLLLKSPCSIRLLAQSLPATFLYAPLSSWSQDPQLWPHNHFANSLLWTIYNCIVRLVCVGYLLMSIFILGSDNVFCSRRLPPTVNFQQLFGLCKLFTVVFWILKLLWQWMQCLVSDLIAKTNIIISCSGVGDVMVTNITEDVSSITSNSSGWMTGDAARSLR